MKKILFVLAAALCLSFTAKAQFYTGGTIGFGLKAGNSGKFVYGIEPEVGYRFNEKSSAGLSILLGGEVSWASENSASGFRFRVNPYYRWSFIDLGPLQFFADGVLSLGTNTTGYSYQSSPTTSYTTFGWGVAISPGLLVDINDSCAFIAHFASIGVSGDAGNSFQDPTATFDLAVVNGPSVGVQYYF